jgi:H+/Cl- antiporter ClcA
MTSDRIKRKKNIASTIGFFAGFAGGHFVHQHITGITLGLLFGLAVREIFD